MNNHHYKFCKCMHCGIIVLRDDPTNGVEKYFICVGCVRKLMAKIQGIPLESVNWFRQEEK